MKKLLYIPIFAAFAVSCGENEQTFDNTADALAHDANVVAEEGANDIYEYNDALLSEQTLLQVEFEKVIDLDDRDVPEEEFILETKKSIEAIHDIQATLDKIEPYGAGGEGFLQAVKDFAVETETYIKLYLDYSEIMSTPDEDLTEDQINDFYEAFEPVDEAYNEAFDAIIEKQEIFAAKNGTSVEEESSFDAHAVYEETK